MAKKPPDFAFKSNVVKYKKQHRFVLHTDNPDIVKDDKGKKMPTPKVGEDGWEERHEHPGGVVEHYHEQGSQLFEAKAADRKEASKKIEVAQEHSLRRMPDPLAGAKELYRNPRYNEKTNEFEPTQILPFKKREED